MTQQSHDRTSRASLTEKQSRVLNFIKTEIAVRGVPPTTREIAEEFGCVQSAAVGFVKALIRKGALKKEPGKARTLSLVQA